MYPTALCQTTNVVVVLATGIASLAGMPLGVLVMWALSEFVRARGREADRAGADRVPELALHRAKVVLRRRLLERSLVHDVRPERRVAEVPRVIDPLGQSVETVEELGEGRPRPLDARRHRLGRDVLGALEVAHDQMLPRR